MTQTNPMPNPTPAEFDTITVTFSYSLPPVLSDAISRADQLMYARRREWCGLIFFSHYKLRNLIADEIVAAVNKALAASKGNTNV